MEPADLSDLYQREGIDCLAVAPPVIDSLIGRWGHRRLSTVRHWTICGEGLDWLDVAEIRRVCAEQVTVQCLSETPASDRFLLECMIGPEARLGSGPMPQGTPLLPFVSGGEAIARVDVASVLPAHNGEDERREADKRPGQPSEIKAGLSTTARKHARRRFFRPQ